MTPALFAVKVTVYVASSFAETRFVILTRAVLPSKEISSGRKSETAFLKAIVASKVCSLFHHLGTEIAYGERV